MCLTWPGARSGRISITTGPLVVSSVRVLPCSVMNHAVLLIDDDGLGSAGAYLESAASLSFNILSGLLTEPLLSLSPFFILSTTSMPETTSPNTVYLPSRNGASARQMKNCELAELGSLA